MLLFSTDSVALDEKSRAHLDEIVPAMIGKPNKIEIRGHSSGRALPASGEFKSVWGLCFARCQAVMDYLRDHGIKAERMRLSQAGPYEPQSEDGGPGLPAENSRVEVYMLSEYVDDLQGPGIEDGDQQDGYEDLRAGPIDPSASSSDRRAASH
jgi:chemotaxis protein MotB